MKRATAAFLCSVVLCTVAESQPSPFAQPPSASSPNWSQLSLGNIMLLVQARHAKIWFAGRAQDWALADFELNHIADDLTARIQSGEYAAGTRLPTVPTLCGLYYVSEATMTRVLAILRDSGLITTVQGRGVFVN